jgi:hypothetical protein
MSEKSRSEFTLEIIKIFLWPTLICFAVIWLGPDLKEILRNRTWKIGVVEVGDRINNLQESMQDALMQQKDFLIRIRANTASPDKIKELAENAINAIDNSQKGVKKDINNIQESLPQKPLVEAANSSGTNGIQEGKMSGPTSARSWELKGFKYILSRDIGPAMQAFSEAEKIWPDYHNVGEIRKLLVSNSQALNTKESAKWKECYQQILKEMSWGMPQEFRQDMQKYLSQS